MTNNRIQTILNGLEGNAKDFKESCETKICSASLQADLETAFARGHKLVRDINDVLTHLTDLKVRLGEGDEE